MPDPTHRLSEALRRAVLAGASGYLLKEAVNDRLVKQIRRVAAGGTLLSSGRVQQAREQLSQALSHRQPAVFTPLEWQVAPLIIKGLSNREIGAALALGDVIVAGLVSSVLATLDGRTS